MANAIGTDWRISRVFTWPITSETDLQGRKFIGGVNFRVFPSHFGDPGFLWRENSAASERCSKIAQRSNQPSSRKRLYWYLGRHFILGRLNSIDWTSGLD